MTFEEFMAQKYTEAAKYSYGVTREHIDIAREAWEAATLAEREACAMIVMGFDLGEDRCNEIAETIRTRRNQ